MPEERDLTPAEHVQPAPAGGWSAADLADDERVDDDFIAANSSRTYPPLMPADERLFPPEEPRGS